MASAARPGRRLPHVHLGLRRRNAHQRDRDLQRYPRLRDGRGLHRDAPCTRLQGRTLRSRDRTRRCGQYAARPDDRGAEPGPAFCGWTGADATRERSRRRGRRAGRLEPDLGNPPPSQRAHAPLHARHERQWPVAHRARPGGPAGGREQLARGQTHRDGLAGRVSDGHPGAQAGARPPLLYERAERARAARGRHGLHDPADVHFVAGLRPVDPGPGPDRPVRRLVRVRFVVRWRRGRTHDRDAGTDAPSRRASRSRRPASWASTSTV